MDDCAPILIPVRRAKRSLKSADYEAVYVLLYLLNRMK
jgi:hypothetical protein